MTAQRFELDANSSSLSPFRQKLKSLLETMGLGEKAVHDVILSVDEALTNVIRHAYGGEKNAKKIQVMLSDQTKQIEIVIEDQGPCFDPRTQPAPELPPQKPGGLGIHFVRTLMDRVDYEALKPQGNRLRLIKYKKEKGERS